MKIIGNRVLSPWSSVVKSLTGVGPRKNKRKESGIRETDKSLKGFCYKGKVKNGGLVEENVFCFQSEINNIIFGCCWKRAIKEGKLRVQ